ncbi:thiol-disulfide oxidoreductase DCC family protein [Marinobacter sp. OP 3.4]|uniref:thiol-disulfide oxidoreductase DCC family protein n=1 Tax=Marinobacter sp. OP 3.4 TaxID=3076501 RepID=UPI002E20CF2B
MVDSSDRLRVYYDGSCPSCIRDREQYEKLAGDAGNNVEWVDITGRDEELRSVGIEPQAALKELHVEDGQGRIHREMDAYILLMSRVRLLKPLAWVMGLPVIRPLLARIYHWMVNRRLERTGRMP